jgi:hypothetical protein
MSKRPEGTRALGARTEGTSGDPVCNSDDRPERWDGTRYGTGTRETIPVISHVECLVISAPGVCWNVVWEKKRHQVHEEGRVTCKGTSRVMEGMVYPARRDVAAEGGDGIRGGTRQRSTYWSVEFE